MNLALLLVSTIALALATDIDPYGGSSQSVHASSARACATLKYALPNKVSYPNSTTYNLENSFNWDIRSILAPHCIFIPLSTQDVSIGLRILTTFQAEFAVRSGGHTPVPGFSNTNGGILISLSNLNGTEFINGDKALKVGPGALWGDVYEKAAEKGKVVVGGRLAEIGVAGLTLGGGLSYLSGRYGLACDNVVGYEIVCADARVIYATATNEFKDLFKALKGGSGNFGVVTRFDFATYPLGDIWGGVTQFDVSDPANMDIFLTALNEYHHHGVLDLDSAITPSIVTAPAFGLTIAAPGMFYAKPVNGTAPPKVFENFWELEETPETNTLRNTNLSTLAADFSGLLPRASLRRGFRVGTIVTSKESLATAVSFFLEEAAKLADIPNFNAVLTPQPIPKSLIQAGIDKGRNMLGLEVSKAPYSWMVLATNWQNSKDDERVSAFEWNVITRFMSWAEAKGYGSDFLYLNDAGKGQLVFAGYGQENLQYLRKVRAKYDPTLVFKKLMPGGFKF